MNPESLLVGAVAYDPKVVTVWEGIRDVLHDDGVAMDFALYSNYERLVHELLAGHVDIAWSTPLAHVRIQKATENRSLSLGMRDSDRDFHAKIVVRKDAGIRALRDLEGRRLAVGSRDSTQARILPLYFLGEAGVDVSRVEIVAFDSDVGKHGDTGRSELDVLRALHEGSVAAGAVGDYVWVIESAAGRIDASQLEVLWTTPGFDHCMFDALPSLDSQRADRFKTALLAMRWDDPRHRRILELEGLKQWMPAREPGYDSLRAALDASNGW